MKDLDGEWKVIKYHGENHLGIWTGKKFHWGGGATFIPFEVEPEFIKTYPKLDNETLWEYGNRVEIQFAREYPLFPVRTPQECAAISQGTGWLASNGDYYPCEYFQHNRIIEHLGKQLLGIVIWWDAIRQLRLDNWATLSECYINLEGERYLTDAQRYTIKNIILPSINSPELIKRLNESLNDLSPDEHKFINYEPLVEPNVFRRRLDN